VVFKHELSAVVSRAPLASCAAAAVEAIIEAGAKQLIAEPWRVSRMIRGAEELTFDQLRTEIARRRALPPPADFNRALAVAQLIRALGQPAFAEAWPMQRATSDTAARQTLAATA
jgi:hypothetical protein